MKLKAVPLLLLLAASPALVLAQGAPAAKRNPFKPAPAMSPATLAGVPSNPDGVPVTDAGAADPSAAPGWRGQPIGLPPSVPPVPGALGDPSVGQGTVSAQFVGTINGENIYRTEGTYRFDKEPRKEKGIVEMSGASSAPATPSAPPRPVQRSK